MHDLSEGNNLISLPGHLDNNDSQYLMQTIINDGTDINFLITQDLILYNTEIILIHLEHLLQT